MTRSVESGDEGDGADGGSRAASGGRAARSRARPGQALLRVLACGVCRTDLHVVDGELTRPKLPLVLGHEIVAEVVASAGRFAPGDRVGVPWLGWTCGACPYCRAGRENLCDRARFTGYDLDGGYAELCVADERFCFAVPPTVRRRRGGAAALRRADRLPLAPGRGRRGTGRPLRLRRGGAHRLPGRAAPGTRGLRADAPGGRARPGVRAIARRDVGGRHRGGAAGRARCRDPLRPGRRARPDGAAATSRKGGIVVCAGIHMSDIPSFPYELLWGERVVRSVANLTRRRRRRVPRARAARCRSRRRSRRFRSRRRTRRSRGFAQATCAARSSSCRSATI